MHFFGTLCKIGINHAVLGGVSRKLSGNQEGMLTTIFGTDVKSVRALRTENGVQAIYNYEKFSVTAFYGAGYSATLYTDGFNAKAEEIILPDDYFKGELEAFYNVIKTGKPDKTEREYVAPVYLLEATIEAYEKNKEIFIDIPFVWY